MGFDYFLFESINFIGIQIFMKNVVLVLWDTIISHEFIF